MGCYIIGVKCGVAPVLSAQGDFYGNECWWTSATYPLLELLVDSIQCVLDGDALHVSRMDLKAEREVQGDLLDLWYAQGQCQVCWVLDSRR